MISSSVLKMASCTLASSSSEVTKSFMKRPVEVPLAKLVILTVLVPWLAVLTLGWASVLTARSRRLIGDLMTTGGGAGASLTTTSGSTGSVLQDASCLLTTGGGGLTAGGACGWGVDCLRLPSSPVKKLISDLSCS